MKPNGKRQLETIFRCTCSWWSIQTLFYNVPSTLAIAEINKEVEFITKYVSERLCQVNTLRKTLQPVQLARNKFPSLQIRMYTQNALVRRKILFSLHYSGVESANEFEHDKKVVMRSVTAFPLYTVLPPPGRTLLIVIFRETPAFCV